MVIEKVARASATQGKQADRLVVAIGDSGREELCPESETVEIGAIPVAEGNRIIPATIRALASLAGECAPKRLLKIERPNRRKDRPYLLVSWECEPFVRYTVGRKPVWGTENSCCVRNERDACDPLFAALSQSERDRILAAVARQSVKIANDASQGLQ